MRKAMELIGRVGVGVIVVLVLGSSCKAEQGSTESQPVTGVAEQATPIRVAASPVKVRIHVLRTQMKIFATPPYVSICDEPTCDGNSFEWLIVGGLQEGETLTIKDAPGHPSCFPNSIPVAIELPYDGAESGPPADACTEDKYGTYWPYIIEMKLADGTTFSTDPGGIIHKRRG